MLMSTPEEFSKVCSKVDLKQQESFAIPFFEEISLL